MVTKSCQKCGQNRDAITRRKREHYARNRERLLQEKREYSERNRDKIARKDRKYYNTDVGHLRRVFNAMKQRCDNPNNKDFKSYGGRGIKNKFKSSDEFVDYVLLDLCVDPRGLEVDRIDNDGNYEKGNIRFVTRKINNGNRRCSKVAL